MTELDELNHATVLRNLYTRYLKDEIYTYVGETLLAVNPFKSIKNKVPKDYYSIIEAGSDYYEVFKSLDPHTYSIAAYALK
jgi:myosin heavy subunit